MRKIVYVPSPFFVYLMIPEENDYFVLQLYPCNLFLVFVGKLTSDGEVWKGEVVCRGKNLGELLQIIEYL